MQKWVLGEADHCPSCLGAEGQVHPLEAWNAAKIFPKSSRLYCTKNCKCRFEEVEASEEVGKLSDIPVRQGNALETEEGQAPADPVTAEQEFRAEQEFQRIQLEGAPLAGGGFEIMAITAGVGNGWEFSETALRESLPLWDGAECFVDHGWMARSVRDLAGVVEAPTWEEAAKGVKARLRPVGPSALLLSELGKEMLREGDDAGRVVRHPRIGFSADVVFTAQGRKVEKILRVLSVDLVFNPARGGAFKRALNSVMAQGVLPMAEENEGIGIAQQSMAGNQAQPVQEQASAEPATVQREHETLARNNETTHQVQVQMCNFLLESGLVASKLPTALTERVRKQFAGRIFEAAELTRAIDDARAMLSELTGAGVVQGPGRISGMVSSEDQYTAALYDLLGAERPAELASVKAAQLSGIRELYLLMTGDQAFTGGYDATRAQFATTADLPGVLKNALNKLIIQQWQELGRSGYRWWEPVVSVEHFTNLHDITGVLLGEVTVLPSVAEAAPYPSLNVADSPEVGAFSKYGGYIGLTLEMFERDETHKLRMFPKKLASAGLRRVSMLVGSIFTSGGGVGPNMADGNPIFTAARRNLGTTALSPTAWESASSAIYNQEMLVGAGGAAPKLALDAKYLIVPRALRLTGRQILYPSYEREANIHSENMQRGEQGDVITCPEFSDANDWAAVADPKLAPAIIIGERYGLLPEIIIADGAANGALFTNDEIRMKARHWLSIFVADFRPLYKANVA